MSAHTPEDLANVAKLLERLRTGRLKVEGTDGTVTPELAGVLERVEALLSTEIVRLTDPLDDGGPAFPHPDYLHQGPDGMSLRDFFAAKAMQSAILKWNSHSLTDESGWYAHQAAEAYKVADAMLKARQS